MVCSEPTRIGDSPTPCPKTSKLYAVTRPPAIIGEHKEVDMLPPTVHIATAAAPAAASSDIINGVIGNFGIWQLRTILIIFLCKIPAAWFMACVLYNAPELQAGIDYTCNTKLIGHPNTVTVSSNQCYVREESTNTTSECKHFNYVSSFSSLIMQFDLVCDREKCIAWTQCWHLLGVLVGSVLGTIMMDGISPRATYSAGAVAQIVCGVVTGYANNFSLHCAFRCLSAVCCAVMVTAGQAIFTDITGGIHRVGATILYDTFWSIGVILLPGLSSFFNSWTLVYVGITFPTLIIIVLLYWTPDSPRWLLRHAVDGCAIDQVERMLRKGAAINERSFQIPPDFRQQLEQLSQQLKGQPPPARWLTLWEGKRAKTHMIAAHIALAAFVSNFMLMLLNIRFFGREYLVPNALAMAFSDFVGCFLALHFALKHNKWKWQWAGAFSIIAGSLGCMGWISTGQDSTIADVKMFWMIIAIIPKTAVSCGQSLSLACLNELMASNKKPIYVFSAVTCARVGLLTVSFLVMVRRIIDTTRTLTFFCVVTIIGGISCCFLLTPEIQLVQGSMQIISNNPKEQTQSVHVVRADGNNSPL